MEARVMKRSHEANRYVLQAFWCVVIVLFPLVLFAAEPLPPYNIDLAQTSLSGVSSGGYMAVQFHVAHSSIVRGVGVIAGGPYNCAQNSAWTATHNCMDPDSSHPVPEVTHLIALTDELVRLRDTDNTIHLKNAKVWLLSGTQDTIVKQPVMDALHQYYEHYVNPANISYKNDLPAGHGMIVDDTTATACALNESPYLNNCTYDAAGHLLQHIYGALNPPSRQLTGTFIEFDQREFLEGDAYSHSLRDTGFAYIPRSCAATRCRVHVALHGCRQHYDAIGDQFYKKAGYTEWADTNDLIVLYPQTIARFGWNWKVFWTLGYIVNPNACWDWWGYDDSDYYKKRGHQITTIRKMLDRLASPRG
jgi:hypothetical protein